MRIVASAFMCIVCAISTVVTVLTGIEPAYDWATLTLLWLIIMNQCEDGGKRK